MANTANWQPFENLSLFAGITLLDTDPSDLPYAPETTFSGRANWRFLERFKLSLDSIHVNSQARLLNAENSNTVFLS